MKQTALLILLFGTFTLAAQPGYMGKKISLSYQYEASPYASFLNIHAGLRETGNEYEGEDNRWVRVAQGHHGAIGFVLNRKTELIGKFGVRKMTYHYFRLWDEQFDDYESSLPTFLANEVHIDVGFRHYFKDYVAPTGSYHQLTVGQSTSSVANKSAIIKLNSEYWISSYEAKVTQEQLKVVRFSYGIGTKKIIVNNFFCSVEANIHFALAKPDKYYRYSDNSSYEVPIEEYSLACLTHNFATYKRYSFLFGLGILL